MSAQGCTPQCMCRCNQLGCGCRQTPIVPSQRYPSGVKTASDACDLCGSPLVAVQVPTKPTAVFVRVCPKCDTRECGWGNDSTGKCDAKVTDAYAKTCPKGHAL